MRAQEADACGHAPDDEACRCWGVVARRDGRSDDVWVSGGVFGGEGRAYGNRFEADRARDWGKGNYSAYTYEITRAGQADATAVPPKPSPKSSKLTAKCALPWCKTWTDADRFCSPRCCEYGARHDKIVANYERFVERLPKGSIEGERLWAAEQMDRELAPIESQWRALKLDRPAFIPPAGAGAGE